MKKFFAGIIIFLTFVSPVFASSFLFGETSSGNGGMDAGKVNCTAYTITDYNLVNELQVYLAGAQTVSAAIYSDTSGHPGTLIVSGSVAGSGGVFNSITISDTMLNPGSTYWLCMILASSGGNSYISHSGASSPGYNSLSSFPSTLGTPDFTVSNYAVDISAYGTISTPTPTPSPTPAPTPTPTPFPNGEAPPQTTNAQVTAQLYSNLSSGGTVQQWNLTLENNTVNSIISGLQLKLRDGWLLGSTYSHDYFDDTFWPPGRIFTWPIPYYWDYPPGVNQNPPQYVIVELKDLTTGAFSTESADLVGSSSASVRTKPLIPVSCDALDIFCQAKQWLFSFFTYLFIPDHAFLTDQFTILQNNLYTRRPFNYILGLQNLDLGTPIGSSSAIPDFNLTIPFVYYHNGVKTNLTPVVVSASGSSIPLADQVATVRDVIRKLLFVATGFNILMSAAKGVIP